MASRNPSEPFDEISIPSGAAAARMVEDTAAVPAPPIPVIEHTHAADRGLLLNPPARSSNLARGFGQWIGDARRRFETARGYVRTRDANSIKTDAMAFARRYPVQTLAGSVLAGLIAGRLLRRK